MKSKIALSALAIACSSLLAVAVHAQAGPPPAMWPETSWHHQMMAKMMKDMTEEMQRMSETMSRGELTAEQRKLMSQRMARMSTMMGRMSGLGARPAMSTPAAKRQMEDMRKQMDAMMRDNRMTPPAK